MSLQDNTFADLEAAYPEYRRVFWSSREGFFPMTNSKTRKNQEMALCKKVRRVVKEQNPKLVALLIDHKIPLELLPRLELCISQFPPGGIRLLNHLVDFFPGVLILQMAVSDKRRDSSTNPRYQEVYQIYETQLAAIVASWVSRSLSPNPNPNPYPISNPDIESPLDAHNSAGSGGSTKPLLLSALVMNPDTHPEFKPAPSLGTI